MSLVLEPSLESLEFFHMPRPLSPEIQEHGEIERPFLGAIQSAIHLFMNEQPGFQVLDDCQDENPKLSSYIHRVARGIPLTESNGKIVSLVKEYSEMLVHLGQDALPNKENEEDLDRWRWNTMIRANLFLDSRVIESGIKVTVPDSIQEFLIENPENLSCFEYALCQIGETRMWHKACDSVDLPGLLIDWGYQPTRQKKPGNLVLYLDNGVPTHLGLYKGDGMVQSKWGNDALIAYIHKLETAPAEYGNQILMFSPP